MRSGFISLIAGACAVVAVHGQPTQRLSQDTLAWVDGEPILARDLRMRVELMPWPGPVRPSTIDSVRSHALSALIAERLLSTESMLRGSLSNTRFDLLRWGLKNVILRDALFQREVAGRLRPTAAEIGEALRRYRENRTVRLFVLARRSDADSLAVLLRADGPDAWVTYGPRILDHDTVAASFGMTDTLLERLVYGIGISGVSRPHRMANDRWVVLALLERMPNPIAARQSEEDRRRAATRILQSRLDGRIADAYYRRHLADKQARSDPGAFNRLAGLVSKVWLEDTARFRRSSGFELTSDMVDLLHARLGDDGSTPLVEMTGPGLSIGQTVEMFRYAPFVSPEAEGLRFQNRLNEQIQLVVAGEYLSREAAVRGLAADPGVQSDLRSWDHYWGAGEMIRAIRDTVTVGVNDLAAELVSRREQLRGRASVLTQEVWTQDAGEATRLASSILQGAPIAEVASGRPRRLPRIEADGASGWFDPADDPVVGFHALLADSGAIVGPVASDGGYVVFRVLGVRTSESAMRGRALASAIEPAAREQKGRHQVNAYVADLAQRRHVRVEADAVRRTTITSVPMFTRRYLGFGGWMNGAPMLLPLWEWVRQLPASSTLPL